VPGVAEGWTARHELWTGMEMKMVGFGCWKEM
jgi:hypothetical protein